MALNLAVIGVGRWGKNHVRVLASLRKSKIGRLVVVDSDVNRAREVSEAYSADAFYGSMEDFISREKDLDAAIVVVPTVYHYKVVEKLLDNYDVFVEKPLAETVEQAFNISIKAARLGRILAVGHIERFNPIVGVTLRFLEQRKTSILSFEARRLGPGPAGNYTLNLGVGHDLLVHDVDISNLFLEGLPRKVFAKSFYVEGFPYEVEVEALYEYPGERISHLVASWRTNPSYKHRSFSLRTEDFVVTADYILRKLVVDDGVNTVEVNNLKTAVHSETTSLEISYLQEEPLKIELLDFLDAVMSRKKPRVSSVEGYIALKCVVKALESAAKQTPLEISWEELEKLNYTS